MKVTKNTSLKLSTIRALRLAGGSSLDKVNKISPSNFINNHSNYDQSNLDFVDKMIEEERDDKFTSFQMFLNETTKKAEVNITEESRKKLAKSLIK